MQLLSMEALVNQGGGGHPLVRVPAVADYNHFLITRLGAGCYKGLFTYYVSQKQGFLRPPPSAMVSIWLTPLPPPSAMVSI